MMYEVQTLTACDGWVNCWYDEGELVYFDTPEKAQLYLDDFLEQIHQEIAFGNIEPGYAPDDYRVAPVHYDPEPEQDKPG